MAKLYRIYCEDVQRKEIEQTVALYFDSFTISEAVGYWIGSKEHSLVIEIFEPSTDYHSQQKVGAIATAIKVKCNQSAVLVIELNCKGTLV